MTHEELMQRRKQMEAQVAPVVRSVPAVFAATPGVASDPDEPAASEGMTAFQGKVWTAITARGWNVYRNSAAEHDFIVMEFYDSSVICQDTLNGKFYRVPLTVDAEGEVTLGEPEEYDITYTPASNSEPETPQDEAEPVAASAGSGRRVRSARIGLSMTATDKPGIYRMLICNSGFANKWLNGRQLYMTPAALEGAVADGLFDGGRCFWLHPDDGQTPGPKRRRLLFAYIVPKSAEIVKNKASGVDVFADVEVLPTQMGNDVRVILDAQLKIGVPLIENSLYCDSGTLEDQTIQGRPALAVLKLNRRCDADFVDEGAFPRASVKYRVAADATPGQPKESMTMDEKKKFEERIAALEGQVKELTVTADAEKKRADALELSAAVDKDLAESGLNPDDQALTRPILLSIGDPNLRKAHLELAKRAYWSKARTNGPGGAAGAEDQGNRTTVALSAEAEAMVASVAASLNMKPEAIEAAKKKALAL